MRPTLILLTFITLILAACAPQAGTPVPPSATTPPTKAAPVASPTSPPGAAAISDEQATQWMYRLIIEGSDEAQQTIDAILASGDTRFVAVFLELMRAGQVGIHKGAGYRAHIAALERLSGQGFDEDWPAWVEWYGATELTPPPGFTGWKGQLLSEIDPGFGDFLRDGLASSVRVEEIMWGGVRVDGIPALDNAAMIPAAEADYLEPEEPVFGIAINGDYRAYPLRIMDWHEMANDVVGGVPVSLAYCTLCGAGVAFDGRASDGNTYTFGSSGFLFRSNKLMYDRQTRTLWNQLTGEPVLGELVGSGVTLDLLPIVLTSWADWQAQHPGTLVLSVDTGYNRPYVPGAAYGDYFASYETMFPVWQRSDLLDTKARVYALRIEDIPKAYPVDLLIAEQVVNDTLGETNLVLIATRADVLVTGENVRVGGVQYNAGGEVRAYDRGGETFTPGPDPDTVLDSQGRPWQVTEEALLGPGGETAPRVNGHLAYWFGWYAFFPKTLLYGSE